jgi:hypothetical protein
MMNKYITILISKYMYNSFSFKKELLVKTVSVLDSNIVNIHYEKYFKYKNIKHKGYTYLSKDYRNYWYDYSNRGRSYFQRFNNLSYY